MDRKFGLFVSHGVLENGTRYASMQGLEIKKSKLSTVGRLGRQSFTLKLLPDLVDKVAKIDFPCLVDLEIEHMATSKGTQGVIVDIFPVPIPSGKSFQDYLDSLIESVDSKDSKPSTASSASSSSSLPPLPSRT